MRSGIITQIYKTVLIALFYIGVGQLINAQNSVIERVYVQTDKQVYLAGENLWTKTYVTELNGVCSPFSKIVYLELIGDTIPYVQQKVEVKKGLADSRIHLPVDLPTGHYRLVGYTRTMQNEGEEVFFNRAITIYNPFIADRLANEKGESSSLEEGKRTLSPSSSVVNVDKRSYLTREKGLVRVQGSGNETYSLSLSIYRKEGLPGLPSVTIEAWKQAIPTEQQIKKASFLPEYEGHIVLGTIISGNKSARTLENEFLTPLIAFPGKGVSVFAGRLENNQQVSFFTKRIDGTQDIITSVLSASRNFFRVDIQSPFATYATRMQFPSLVLSDSLRVGLLERSIGVQAMQSFYGDTIWHTTSEGGHLSDKPEFTYKLDEYTRFTTMREVIGEFVQGLRFRRVEGRRYLTSQTEERTGYTTANTLVLLDGVPLLDHESIYEYNPLLVEQIDLYRGKFVFGGQIFNGLAHFQTYDHGYRGVKLDSSSQLFTYKGTEPQSYFFMPDYSDPKARASRLPDMRHTLLWMPNIETKGNQLIEVPFFTSDLKGEFVVVVEGLSRNGKTIRSSVDFKVE